MSLYKKINGFHPPPACPRDFAAQIQTVVWKYNKLIDEYEDSQARVRNMTRDNRILSQKYDELKRASELLAEKYEALIERSKDLRNDARTRTDQGIDETEADTDADNSPLSKEEVEKILAHREENLSVNKQEK